jgi:hypothetical protein
MVLQGVRICALWYEESRRIVCTFTSDCESFWIVTILFKLIELGVVENVRATSRDRV